MDARTSHVLEFGDFRLDLEEHCLFRSDGTEVPMTPRVFETLRYLVEHAGRVMDKNTIMEAVWADCLVEENNLAQAISKLRHVFGEKTAAPRYIATVPGRGYRFIADVRTCRNGARLDRPIPAIVAPPTPVAILPAAEVPKLKSSRQSLFVTAIALIVFVGGALVFLRYFKSPPGQPPVRPNTETVSIAEKSIAVLPFANLTSDPDTAYFAEGVKDEILTRLSKIASLKVISRTSTQEFALKPHNVREIALRLGVAHILEGSVQKSGDTVRVTVQLIHAPSDTHLWAESYDRKLTDVLQVESEIAQRIARALAATVTGDEKRALTAVATDNVEAYEAYLRGRYFWNKRTAEGFYEAVAHLSRAVELDPSYAPAYAGLADAIYFRGGADAASYSEALRKSEALLQKALALDETLADAHASLGLLTMNSGSDWARAEAEFKRAIELNPNYATAHQWYGEFLAYMGRFDEAIAQSVRARELDPLSLIINTDLAKVHMLARRYQDAIELFGAALKLDPEFPEAHALLALAYSGAGRHDEAISELRRIKGLEQTPGYLAFLGYVYGAAGRTSESRQVIDQLTELSSHKYVVPFWFAIVWAGLGEADQTFPCLERSLVEPPFYGAVTFKVAPAFDPIRSDRRFDDLLRRANFTR